MMVSTTLVIVFAIVLFLAGVNRRSGGSKGMYCTIHYGDKLLVFQSCLASTCCLQ